MDYVILGTLKREDALVDRITFSYDIACQWSKNLSKRMKSYPAHLQPDLANRMVRYKVPKFNLPAHGDSCQTRYNFNFTRGAGRTCGEGIEQGWSASNAASMSTKEMSPGYRAEALDGFWNWWNFRKIVALGKPISQPHALHILTPPIFRRSTSEAGHRRGAHGGGARFLLRSSARCGTSRRQGSVG